MQNYHKHTSHSNLFTPFLDSHIQYQAYADRAKELGQMVLSSVEHGWQSNHPKVWQCAQQNGLKFIFGTEAYYVKDRKEQDNSNGHIIVLAKNHDGFLQINNMLSEANETGFYYVPRVDLELLRQLNPNDVWVTSACVAGWGKVNKEDKTVLWHDDIDNTMMSIAEHFGGNFRLEVQYHNTVWQKMVNTKCLEWSRKYHIPLVAGLDSHYITPSQSQERQYLRESSGIHMNDEDHEFDAEVYEDYPDEATVMDRFMKQGVLNADEILRAMKQSDELLEFDDITYNMERKLIAYPKGITQEERNHLFEDRIWKSWEKYKEHIDPAKESEYVAGIKDEINTITSTNTSSYFLFDSDMVALGKKKGGVITPTGRGSAGGMFINTLLGLSTLDRFALPVKLYPERFVTAERLKTSLPDLDLNLSDQKPFTEAQEELLGKGHAYQMVAYGTLKTKAAFKTYARVAGVDADLANEISKQIEEYEKEVANTEDEDEKENIEIGDFVDEQYIPLIEKSASYRGVIVSKSPAPCGFLIYDGDIRSEIGLMRVASKQKKTSVMCTAIDGYTADEFGYVKNDELIVSVVGINAEAFRRAGIPQPSSSELIELTKNDKEVWKVFANGWGQGINQCQKASTIEKLKQYKPNCLQDLSAFVAAIRPGFKSQVKDFCSRKRFKYGIPTIDKILEVNDSAHSSWMLYQENTMTLLNLAGISMADTYPIIKAISKKKVKVIEAAKDRFLDGISKYMVEHDNVLEDKAHEAAEKMWKVIIDSSSYAFNASHSVAVSLDALYGAYLKAHYPYEYYLTLLDHYSGKGNKDKIAEIKAEMKAAYDIEIAPPKFRQDNRSYSCDKANHTVSDALPSIKTITAGVANALYEHKNNFYCYFVDLLHDLDNDQRINSTKITTLIKCKYFDEFGGNAKLLKLYDMYSNGKLAVKKTLKESTQETRLKALRDIEDELPDEYLPADEQVQFETVHYGTPISIYPECRMQYVALEINDKYTPWIRSYSMATGKVGKFKIKKKVYSSSPITIGDVFLVQSYKKTEAARYNGKVRTPIPGVYDIWIDQYKITRKC